MLKRTGRPENSHRVGNSFSKFYRTTEDNNEIIPYIHLGKLRENSFSLFWYLSASNGNRVNKFHMQEFLGIQLWSLKSNTSSYVTQKTNCSSQLRPPLFPYSELNVHLVLRTYCLIYPIMDFPVAERCSFPIIGSSSVVRSVSILQSLVLVGKSRDLAMSWGFKVNWGNTHKA